VQQNGRIRWYVDFTSFVQCHILVRRRYLRGVECHGGRDIAGISKQFGGNKMFDPY